MLHRRQHNARRDPVPIPSQRAGNHDSQSAARHDLRLGTARPGRCSQGHPGLFTSGILEEAGERQEAAVSLLKPFPSPLPRLVSRYPTLRFSQRRLSALTTPAHFTRSMHVAMGLGSQPCPFRPTLKRVRRSVFVPACQIVMCRIRKHGADRRAPWAWPRRVVRPCVGCCACICAWYCP